ncbi:hypothetical protein [Listeria monocytogenes]|uniref:DUF2158 domain-containing protein n=1 Tax=Listeria monocytogenes TaxID=1639 RepID=A0A6C7MLY3_LISMN|nr:hypothetical protein [Listeria monocytogenes]EAW7125216.1 hypothetical protein [Listeria monocytogenes]ECC0538330.1 hypothetical protein [Listeria monocytogenes]EJN2659571.1 hypothetical protein [Listeria monocytogenes]MBC1622322.1 hypothetical protein [Listeria welshimeri]
MSIMVGSEVEIQDRSGVEHELIEGQRCMVTRVHPGGLMLTVWDGFTELDIPKSQTKEVKAK